MVRILKIAILITLSVFYACQVCYAQVKQQERSLPISGQVEDRNIYFYPVKQSIGEIFSLPVGHNNTTKAKSLRLHFVVKEKAESGAWRVRILNNKGDVAWEFDSGSEPDVKEFWSAEVYGTNVTVQIFSTVARSTLQLVSDRRIATLIEPIREQSIFGNYDLIPIVRATLAKYKTWAKAVARLTFVSDDHKAACPCTGFLVSPNLFLTNDHCPGSDEEIRSAIVEFDYDEEFAPTKMYRLEKTITRDPKLDFALYQLNRDVTDREYLKLKDEDLNLTSCKPLVLIQHPGGLPKQISLLGCRISASFTDVSPPTDFAHECDTEGGSSGSPVQDLDGMVVGLHHYGFGSAASQKINQAVKAGAILKSIEKRKKAVYEILANL